MPTFAGNTFNVRRQGLSIPEFTTPYNYNVEHIPFSNSDVIDLGGKGADQLSCTILIPVAAVTTWKNLLGTTGTLVWFHAQSFSVVLVQMGDVEFLRGDEGAYADVTFVKV